jgi:hypothetical protein
MEPARRRDVDVLHAERKQHQSDRREEGKAEPGEYAAEQACTVRRRNSVAATSFPCTNCPALSTPQATCWRTRGPRCPSGRAVVLPVRLKVGSEAR